MRNHASPFGPVQLIKQDKIPVCNYHTLQSRRPRHRACSKRVDGPLGHQPPLPNNRAQL